MKRISYILLMAALTLPAQGASFRPTIQKTNEVTDRVRRQSLTLIQGSTWDVGYTFEQNGTKMNLTGATSALLKYTPANSDNGVWVQTVTGVVDVATNGHILIPFDPVDLNTNSTDGGVFAFRVEVADATTTFVNAWGDLNIIKDPTAGLTNTFPTGLSQINWSLYTYLNTSTAGPYREGTNATFSSVSGGSVNIDIMDGVSPNTEGRIIYANASSNWVSLEPGTEDARLTMESGVPAWQAPGGTNKTAVLAGTMIDVATNANDRTVSHEDTSSQASVDNSNGNVIQDVTLDTRGHITALGSTDLDDRYYTETEMDFVIITQSTHTEQINILMASTSKWDEAYVFVSVNSNGIYYMLSRTSQWDTAYGWGDHGTNGYLITGGIGASTNLSDYNNDVPFLETGDTGASTNLSDYNNDALFLITGGVGASTNLSDYNDDVGFMQDLIDDTAPKLSTNLNYSGFKGTNAADGVVATDIATFGQLTASSNGAVATALGYTIASSNASDALSLANSNALYTQVQSEASARESADDTIEANLSDTEENVLALQILNAFDNDRYSMDSPDGNVINFDTTGGLDTRYSTNYTLDAGNDKIATDYVAASAIIAKIKLDMDDDAADKLVADNGDFDDGGAGITSVVDTATISVSGKINGGFIFTNSYYLLGGYDATLDTGKGTVAYWWNLGGAGYMTAFGEAARDKDMNFRLDNGNTVFGTEFGGVGGSIIDNSAAIAFNTWIHFAWVQNGTQGIMYTNGVAWGGGYDTQDGNWIDDIGEDGYEVVIVGDRLRATAQCDGVMDDYRVYTQALSQAQITTLYNSDSGTEDDLMLASSGGPMTLVSTNTIFVDLFSYVKFRMLMDTNNMATLNTDITVDFSFDGNTTSNRLVLKDDGPFYGTEDKHWVTGVFTNAAPGSNCVWTLGTTTNSFSDYYAIGYTLDQ